MGRRKKVENNKRFRPFSGWVNIYTLKTNVFGSEITSEPTNYTELEELNFVA